MILYGSSFSPFVRKVLAYAAERGIEMELVQTRLDSADPEFLRASPFRKMPAFTDGDFAISDSTAIITYLEPLGALLIASLLLKEPITPYTVIGGVIILGSGLLLVLQQPKSKN